MKVKLEKNNYCNFCGKEDDSEAITQKDVLYFKRELSGGLGATICKKCLEELIQQGKELL